MDPISGAGLSRRTFGIALTATVLALLAGCGNGDETTAGSLSGSSTPEPTSAAFPVTIDHKYGATTVPGQPKRVAVVGLMEQDALLALGIVPVATTEWFGGYPGGIWPWAKDKLGAAALPVVLSYTDGIQFEKVAALEPDLIVAMYSAITEDDYATLSKIAPTIAQPKSSSIDWAASWQEVTTTLGLAVGQPDKAKELVKDTDALLAKYAADNPTFAGKTGLVATPYEGFYVYGAKDPRGQLLQSLGFVMPEGLDAVSGKEFGGNVSKERTDLLDVDALVWLLDKYDTDKKKIDGNALYTALEVSKQDRDIFIAGDKEKAYYGATSFITVLSMPTLLDGLVPQLAAAVDGDPATAVPMVTALPTPAAG
jgi:iron complex transport system substrate-binding protein